MIHTHTLFSHQIGENTAMASLHLIVESGSLLAGVSKLYGGV